MKNLTMSDLGKSVIREKSENLFITGDSYRSYPTIIITPTRGRQDVEFVCECGKKHKKNVYSGIHPWVIEGWKRLIKPMNSPVIDIIIGNMEVGEAYNTAIDHILKDQSLASFKYFLFLEDDIIVPNPLPNSYGSLITLYKHLDTYDVASGLYWTKSDPSLPLVYGDGNIDQENQFMVNNNWKTGDVVEVNGCGMGLTVMKRSLFEDTRIEKPWFKTCTEVNANGVTEQSTQDLYIYKKIKKLGYRICVDTSLRASHLDVNTEVIY